MRSFESSRYSRYSRYNRYSRYLGIGAQLREQHAGRAEEKARISRLFRLEPHRVAHRAARAAAVTLGGDALGKGDRCNAPRLRDDDVALTAAARGARVLEEILWHLCRLPAAGLACVCGARLA